MCSHNPIKEIPGHISALQQLKLLDVSGMALAQLPGELAGLPSLNRLLCQGNALTALPEGLGLHQSRLQHVSTSLDLPSRWRPYLLPCSQERLMRHCVQCCS